MAIKYNSENKTWHAEVERANRVALIEEYLGFTNIVIEVLEWRNGQQRRVGLTSSGVIVIRPLNYDTIITAFMAREEQAVRICRKAGKKCVPPKLLEKVRKNVKRHPEILYA